jgi:uracil-DNA glycosylase family 4
MGFFFENNTNKSKENKLATLYGCKICPFNNCSRILPEGNPEADYYFLGGFPSVQSVKEQSPLAGDIHNTLFHALSLIELEGRTLRFNNMINCGTATDEKKKQLAFECCLPNIIKDIELIKPKVIIGFGNIPLKYFIGGKDVHLWRGRLIPIKVGSHNCWYFPVYDLQFLVDNKQQYESKFDQAFIWDIKKIFNIDLVPYEIVEPNDENVTYFYGRLLEEFANIKEKIPLSNNILAIDFETDSLIPKFGDIISVAIGTFSNTIVFPLVHPDAWNFLGSNKKEVLYQFLKNILEIPRYCIAHNNKFESEWIREKTGLNFTVPYDTKAMAFLLDERASKHESLLSLDILTKMYLGFNLKDYSPNIDRKNILNSPLLDILKYNALDTKYTYTLYYELQIKLDKEYLNHLKYSLSNTGEVLAIVQNSGLDIDYKVLNELDNKYTTKLKELSNNINELEEIIKYKKNKGEFNPMSPDQVAFVLTEYMDIPLNKSKKDKYITDEPVLEKISKEGNKLAQYILEYRGINKLKSTYIDNIRNEDFNGKIYPEFNHLFTKTGRLSSGNSENA